MNSLSSHDKSKFKRNYEEKQFELGMSFDLLSPTSNKKGRDSDVFTSDEEDNQFWNCDIELRVKDML